jgi:hypothetical protein
MVRSMRSTRAAPAVHLVARPKRAGGTRIALTSRMHASTTMTRNVIVVPPELALVTAWHLMIRERIRHLPVVRAGALLGMRSDRDVLRSRDDGQGYRCRRPHLYDARQEGRRRRRGRGASAYLLSSLLQWEGRGATDPLPSSSTSSRCTTSRRNRRPTRMPRCLGMPSPRSTREYRPGCTSCWSTTRMMR